MKTISIVVPAYNEEACIPELVRSIHNTFKNLQFNYELIIVDDGSVDNSFEIIREQSKKFSFVKGIKLSRNMGHQAALDCGLNHAYGDAVISMDADLQHPPDLLPEMIRLWDEEGYDIVTTQKMENREAGFIYKIWAKLFYSFFNKYSQIKLTPNGSDFRLMSRKSLEAVLSMPEYHKFYRGMVHFVGFKSTTIPFNVQKRFAGKRKYNFRQSLNLASDGLVSFSDFALKIPMILGLIVFFVVILFMIISLVKLLFLGDQFEKGWTSIVVLIILSFSIQLVFMGIMGVYIGKIYFEVKRRPVFFTQEKIGDFKK